MRQGPWSPNMMCAMRLRRHGMPFSTLRWPWGDGNAAFWALRMMSVPLAANLREGQIA